MSYILQNRYGVCIVNNKATDGQVQTFTERSAEIDRDNFMCIMKKLNFICINEKQQVDLSAKEWDHRKYSDVRRDPQNCCILCQIKSKKYSDVDCFLLAISSHGREITETEIQFSDGNWIKLSEIITSLSDENFENLKGKPRILLLQASRGNPEVYNEDHGVPINVITEKNITSHEGCQDGDAHLESEDVRVSNPTPLSHRQATQIIVPPNFLIVYATATGRRAKIRNKSDGDCKVGSWFVSELRSAVEEHKFEVGPMNFLSLVTAVTGNVGRNYESISYKRKDGEIVNGPDGNPEINKKKSGLKNAVCSVHTLLKPLIFDAVSTKSSLPEPAHLQ